MRRTTTLLATALLLAGAAVGCSASQKEIAKECEAALTEEATKTDRPSECEGLSQKNYDAVLLNWSLENALDDMPKKQRDTLDYYDDGSINGSV
ncbi:hypothetical protein AB0I66_21580 [Streptomyces sp. NPDC050439]|uniref:hypothetical protein n=1 Tax=unclassified Streptomyces TaxID=2593676 RepID=UPI003442B3E3